MVIHYEKGSVGFEPFYKVGPVSLGIIFFISGELKNCISKND
jgi:hypothetical protein